ncbi:MAG: hypothetical protein ACI86X_002140 [Moritella sp.]|jgi:hypothetical protein
MNVAYLNSPDFLFFSDASKQLEHMIEHLQSDNCRDNEHGDIEQYIQKNDLKFYAACFKVISI